MRSVFSFFECFPDFPTIEIVEIGSNPTNHKGFPQVYGSFLRHGRCRVTGFDPDPRAFEALQEKQDEALRFFPYAIGDGTEQTLYECVRSTMSSLYEPNADLLRHFDWLDVNSRVERETRVQTKRLDDIPELGACDYLHMDVQGAELMCLRGAEKLLDKVLVVHAEVLFLEMYKNQPLFSEVEIFLRKKGFMLHRVNDLQTRTFRPLSVNGKENTGWAQWFWGDAVLLRNIADWDALSADQLLRMAALMHECYQAFDLVAAMLLRRDAKAGTHDAPRYLRLLARDVPELVMQPTTGP